MHQTSTISPCRPPATNADGVMAVTPFAGCRVGTLHLDALGNALQVGDTVQFSDWMPVEVITALLPGGRFAHGDKTNFCCVVVLVASPVLALCNSCLRVRHFASYELAQNADCICGASAQNADNYCPCSGCEHDANLLLAGQRTGLPGIPEHVNLTGWTAENGVAA